MILTLSTSRFERLVNKSMETDRDLVDAPAEAVQSVEAPALIIAARRAARLDSHRRDESDS
jgi:hypothetical protein